MEKGIIKIDTINKNKPIKKTNKNNRSMTKREQIIELLNKCIIGESVANTADKILALFCVVGRSEQYCDNADRHNRHILNDGFAYCPECGKEI